MGLIVQKYGGSSLDSPEKIKVLARRIVDRYDSGDRLVIVVSAVGKTTDTLEARAALLSACPDPREVDMIISVGERESISLMAIAINDIRPGLAVSFTGSQIGLITDNNHRNARILEIRGDRLVEALEKGRIPVIAGFQGISTEKQITTLGRGGSDTTAVAVAAALKADLCEIYSDVRGVYSADPKFCPDAVLIEHLDHNTMLTISSLGAKVLRDAAVEYAHRLGVNITTGLSRTGDTGSLICVDPRLNRNKFVSLVRNENLFYAVGQNDGHLCDDLQNIRFFQRTESGSTAIYSSKPNSTESLCCNSTSIVGFGIRSEQEKLCRMQELLRPSKIIAFELTDIKFEIYTENVVKKDVFNDLHSLFFS